MSECSCWVKYPNPMHKGKNGKWKCVDDYECIQDLQTVETPIGLTAVRRKTHCKQKMEKKRMDEIEQLKDLRAHCQDMTRGGDGIFQDLWGKDVKALDKAIEALKRQQEAPEIKQTICDNFCKYPMSWSEKENGPLAESETCRQCPLNRL